MDMRHQRIIRKPGKGPAVAVVGDVYRVLATAEHEMAVPECPVPYGCWEPCA